jgi:hypothetical protein
VDNPVFTFGPFRLNLAERLLLDALWVRADVRVPFCAAE